MKKVLPTEQQEQIALFQWADYHPICKHYLIAIPNGGSRHLLEAKNLKKAGVKSGVSDIFLPYPAKGYYGLWIELKRNKIYTPSEQSSESWKNQKLWNEKMRSLGYDERFCFGCKEAIDVIEYYLGD